MDLRGFTRENTGCSVEIRELFLAGAIDRVVFVVNDRTDDALLRETFDEAARAAGSAAVPQVFRLEGLTRDALHALFRLLAQASQRVGTSSSDQPRDTASFRN
jgi:hypothetical protein